MACLPCMIALSGPDSRNGGVRLPSGLSGDQEENRWAQTVVPFAVGAIGVYLIMSKILPVAGRRA